MNINLNATLTKYCGSDYLEVLKPVLGNPNDVNLDVYKLKINKMYKCEKNIITLFKAINKINPSKDLALIHDKLIKESNNLEINKNTFIIKEKYSFNKKTRKNVKVSETEVINDKYLPSELYKTDWFNIIKSIEKSIYREMFNIFNYQSVVKEKDGKTTDARRKIDTIFTFDKYQEILKNTENRNKIIIYNIDVLDEEIFNNFLKIHYFASTIINELLTPTYDPHLKIQKAWDKKLHTMFKPETLRKMKISKENICKMLENLMSSNYKAQITGNQKYFLQMLQQNISEQDFDEISGARFIDMLSDVNEDILGVDKNVAIYARQSKKFINEIKRNGGEFNQDIIRQCGELLAGQGKIEDIKDINDLLSVEDIDQLKELDNLFEEDK